MRDDNTSSILTKMQNKINSGIALHIYLCFSLRNDHTFVVELVSHPISWRDFWDRGHISLCLEDVKHYY